MSLFSRIRLIYRAHRYRWKLDPAEIAFLLAHTKPGTTALDIGAHKGGYTYWLAKSVGPQGRAIAFEPQPELAGRLRRSFCPKRVTVENMGISSQCGQLALNVPGNGPSPGASFEKPAANGAGRSFTVPVATLDSYLRQSAPPVSFIKCDVEGHELHVFQGAEQTLRRDRPVLMFECEQRHHVRDSIDGVFSYLRAIDYTGFFFLRGQLRPLAEFVPAQHQNPASPEWYSNNFAFLPAGAGIDGAGN